MAQVGRHDHGRQLTFRLRFNEEVVCTHYGAERGYEYEGCALGTLPEWVVPSVMNFVTQPWAAAEEGGGEGRTWWRLS
jgi:hypothetical protein